MWTFLNWYLTALHFKKIVHAPVQITLLERDAHRQASLRVDSISFDPPSVCLNITLLVHYGIANRDGRRGSGGDSHQTGKEG